MRFPYHHVPPRLNTLTLFTIFHWRVNWSSDGQSIFLYLSWLPSRAIKILLWGLVGYGGEPPLVEYIIWSHVRICLVIDGQRWFFQPQGNVTWLIYFSAFFRPSSSKRWLPRARLTFPWCDEWWVEKRVHLALLGQRGVEVKIRSRSHLMFPIK